MTTRGLPADADSRRQPRGWRGLILFWGLTLGVLGCGAVVLQLLGPPDGGATVKTAQALPHEAAPSEPAGVAKPALPPAQGQHPVVQRPGSALPGPIAAPDPALLEPGHGPDGGMLPRIGADQRIPGQVYARGFASEPGRPRIGIVLAGIGMNAADSAQAIESLPGELTLALSPYAPQNPELLDLARRNGHELLLSIPMEPTGFSLNDPGEHALLTGATPEQNQRNLEWALGRFAGYAGTTAALGGQLNGERFPTMAEQMRPVLNHLAARGLFYVDPRIAPKSETGGTPPALPYAWNRSIDLIVDDPADAASLEAKLAALEAIARDKGSALGLVGTPTPVALERLVAWTNGLAARGLVLAPASALMLPPREVLTGEVLQ
jgi:polysaccharide deacetylase 2 family uncharacterized protein YibQ